MKMFPLQPRETLAAVLLALTLSTPLAAEPGETAGAGMRHPSAPAPQWQVRLTLAGEPPLLWGEAGLGPRHLSLFGDYYIPHAWGLRATGGILLGQGSTGQNAARMGASSERHMNLLSGVAPSWWTDAPGAGEGGASPEVTPYLGLGYTGSTAHGSLGFFADVGLRGLQPRSGVRLGTQGGSGLHRDIDAGNWRTWRDWRFAPILQLGVSYAF